MSESLTYKDMPLSQIIGEFYATAGTFNGFVHVPSKSLLGKFGPNAWYRAKFESDEGIEAEIVEWRNRFSANDFLNRIVIRYNSEIVYSANVHRDNPSIHQDQRACREGEWIKKVIELTKRYGNPDF